MAVDEPPAKPAPSPAAAKSPAAVAAKSPTPKKAPAQASPAPAPSPGASYCCTMLASWQYVRLASGLHIEKTTHRGPSIAATAAPAAAVPEAAAAGGDAEMADAAPEEAKEGKKGKRGPAPHMGLTVKQARRRRRRRPSPHSAHASLLPRDSDVARILAEALLLLCRIAAAFRVSPLSPGRARSDSHLPSLPAPRHPRPSTQLASDSIMKTARSTWLLPDGAARPAYDPELVRTIYASELGNGEKLPALQRASVLEVSQARAGFSTSPRSRAGKSVHHHVHARRAMSARVVHPGCSAR